MAHLNLDIFSFGVGGGKHCKIARFFKTDPTPDPYLGCTFWPEFRVDSGSSPIYVSPVFIVGVGVNSRSGSSSRSIFGLFFLTCILNLGSTLAMVPFMSHLWLIVVGGQLQIQIYIWVVLFELNFHCIDIMLTLCYLQNSTFFLITPFQVVRFEKFLHKWDFLFPDDHFEYQQPYVTFKIECFVP